MEQMRHNTMITAEAAVEHTGVRHGAWLAFLYIFTIAFGGVFGAAYGLMHPTSFPEIYGFNLNDFLRENFSESTLREIGKIGGGISGAFSGLVFTRTAHVCIQEPT